MPPAIVDHTHETTNPSSSLLRRSSKSSASSFTITDYRDNAEVIVPVTINPLAANRDDQVRHVASIVCPFLADDDDDTNPNPEVPVTKDGKASLLVKPLLGGLSNELFIVSKEGCPSVLVRIHPGNVHTNQDTKAPGEMKLNEVVDREVENRFVAWLSRKGMAPIFYGRFENGRVEELYPNVTPLTHLEMPFYGNQIAKALANFHALQAPSHVLPKPMDGIPSRFHTVDAWVQGIQDSINPPLHHHLLSTIQSEWKWLRAQLLLEPTSNPSHSPVQLRALRFIRETVLTHMDVQSLNVLKDSNDTNGRGKIRLIDFEYVGWNPRAADLANTFCEHCDMNNIRADYEKEYPSEKIQNSFLKAYLQQLQVVDELVVSDKDWDEVLETLRTEIGRFSLLSHLGWAAWSMLMVVQAGSGIDFDYVAYAKHRMDGYDFGKGRFFSMTKKQQERLE